MRCLLESAGRLLNVFEKILISINQVGERGNFLSVADTFLEREVMRAVGSAATSALPPIAIELLNGGK